MERREEEGKGRERKKRKKKRQDTESYKIKREREEKSHTHTKHLGVCQHMLPQVGFCVLSQTHFTIECLRAFQRTVLHQMVQVHCCVACREGGNKREGEEGGEKTEVERGVRQQSTTCRPPSLQASPWQLSSFFTHTHVHSHTRTFTHTYIHTHTHARTYAQTIMFQ